MNAKTRSALTLLTAALTLSLGCDQPAGALSERDAQLELDRDMDSELERELASESALDDDSIDDDDTVSDDFAVSQDSASLPLCSQLTANCQYRITRVKDKVAGNSFFDVCDPGITHRSVYLDTYRCNGTPFFLPWSPACPGAGSLTCGCMDGTPPDDLFTQPGEIYASNCHEPQCDCIPDPDPLPPTAYGPVTSPQDDGCEAAPAAALQEVIDDLEALPGVSCDALDATATCTLDVPDNGGDPLSSTEATATAFLDLCQPGATWQAGYHLEDLTLTCGFGFCGYQLPDSWTPAT